MIAFHSTNAKRSSPTSDTNLLSHLDALRQCDALRADRDAAREDARRRLDIVYRIKDDLLDEKNRAEAAEAREAAAVERARTLRQALCEAQDALCDLRPIPSIERNNRVARIIHHALLATATTTDAERPSPDPDLSGGAAVSPEQQPPPHEAQQ